VTPEQAYIPDFTNPYEQAIYDDEGSCLPSLVPEESQSQANADQCHEQSDGHCCCSLSFRHSGWQQQREKVYTALVQTGAGQATLERFAYCGQNAWVVQNPNDPSDFRVASTRCKNRWCMPCSQQKARLICSAIYDHLKTRRVRFLTLTIGGTSLPLADRLNHLYLSFQALRRTKSWKASVLGGVAFLEVKRGTLLDRWHPHLHVLIEGSYFAQQTIAKLWKEITKDSCIVDIRRADNKDGITRYITKYITKPLDSSLQRMPAKLAECMTALKGRKIAMTFGTWRGLQLTDSKPTNDWLPIAPLDELIHRAAHGEPWASAVLDHLKRKTQPWKQDSAKQSPIRAGPTSPGRCPSDYTDSPTAPTVQGH